MSERAIGELEFLRKLQRLLAEGDFVATYKFALLNALADMSLEREPAADGHAQRDEFLYKESQFADGAVRLLPGVPAALRALYGLVLDAVRGAWVRQIASIGANRPLLAGADLASFLFGSERGNLDRFRAVLRDHQGGRCLYCRKELRGAGCVDHFIAWSRYPVDLGHNFVLAHDACNAHKRDFLAYPAHRTHGSTTSRRPMALGDGTESQPLRRHAGTGGGVVPR